MKLEDFELGGTPLSTSDIKQGKVLTTKFKPNLAYAWDDGVAIGRYLAELREGRIIARMCYKCRRIMLPPRMFCELCFRPTDEWVYVKDTGTVNTFSVVHVNWDASRRGPKEPPLIPAVIEIDEASPGMGIMHMLGEVDPELVAVGMKVKAVWKKAEDRTGAITDILYFKPIGAPAKRAGRRRKRG
jgi:uncharacterized OB-fold protein